jgi:hypothetical protein
MMMAKIADLAPLAKKVNETTDQINQIISTLNEKLAKLNLGVEIWLDRPGCALDATGWQVQHATCRTRNLWLLGYSRLDAGWQLTVKQVTEESAIDDGGEEHLEELNPRYFPLLSASRKLRLAALDQVPRLLDEMNDEGRKLLDTVSTARKLAESL